MAKTTAALLPKTMRRLQSLGLRLRLARKRRGLTAKLTAERAGMTTMTLRALENGSPGVTMGAYLSVLYVLGLDADIDLVAKTDDLGNALVNEKMLNPRRSRSDSLT